MTDSTILPLGSLGSVVTANANKSLKYLAADYGYQFVDISNVSTPASEQGMSATSEVFLADMNTNLHPSIQYGIPYMARQVLAALPEAEEPAAEPMEPAEEAEPAVEAPSYDIVVDLGRFKQVNYVFVDGKRVKDYTMNGYQITIPYDNPDATTLTVGIVDANKKLSVQVYQLTFRDGYFGYHVYGTNDICSTVTTPAKNLVKVTKAAFKKLVA